MCPRSSYLLFGSAEAARCTGRGGCFPPRRAARAVLDRPLRDRKSTRLNSSHPSISYAVFCLKKKNRVAHVATRLGVARIAPARRAVLGRPVCDRRVLRHRMARLTEHLELAVSSHTAIHLVFL